MTSWEYAAIVRGDQTYVSGETGKGSTYTWYLAKPGNETHLISKRKRTRGSKFEIMKIIPSTWANIEWAKRHHEEVEKGKEMLKGHPNRGEGDLDYDFEINDSKPIILFESTDPLVLVNMAGKAGWEITGALGSDWIEVSHRMMRRKI